MWIRTAIALACVLGVLSFSPLRLPGSPSRLRVEPDIRTRGLKQFAVDKEKVEELFFNPPKYLLEVAKKNADKRLTVADVAAAGGADIPTARRDLMRLATTIGATLEVTNGGEILYNIPRDFEQRLLQKSFGRRAQLLFDAASPPLFYLFRISFGVMLILSLAIITTAIFVATSSSSSSSDDDNRSSSRSSSSSSFNVNLLFNMFSSDSGGGVFSYNSRRSTPQSMNFLESFFSYVFGDPDPNADYAQDLSVRVAQLVRQNGGVVVAEQLAPFVLDPPPLPRLSSAGGRETGMGEAFAESLVVDEAYVLPSALQYQGQPAVSENGHIIYIFAELMRSALSTPPEQYQEARTWRGAGNVDGALLEKEVPFSAAGTSLQAMALSLGILNLGGAAVLGDILAKARLTTAAAAALGGASTGSAYLVAVSGIYPLLLGYAVLYNAIPLARFFLNRRANEKIKERNDRRIGWQQLLRSDESIRAKLEDRENYQKSMSRDGDDLDIIFSSELDKSEPS